MTSIVLAVAGCVLALVGGFALYAREEIFNADAFAENSAETLKDEQVRQALGRRIADQAIDRGPDALINVAPVLNTVVDGVLESAPFRAAYRKAARKLYRALFVKDKDELALTVGSADVLVADSIETVSPEVGRQIPRDLGDRVVQITDSKIVLKIVQISEEVRFLGVLLPILALLCLGGSVAIAPDRRRALVLVAGGLALAAVAGFVAVLIGRSVLLAQFDDETVRLAVAAVYEAFFSGFESLALYVALIAILIAAAATMARERDPVAPARRVYAFITQVPDTTHGRAGRAVVIGAVGVVFVFEPETAVKVLGVVIGAYAVFFAACELLALLGPPLQEHGEGRRLTLRVAAGGAAVLVALVVGVIALTTGGDEGEREIKRPPGEVTNCNGFPQLCEKTLDQVAFPAAHNAMSAASLPGWYQPNQRFDIRRQLNDDVRAFLIDSHYGIKRESGPVLTDLERAESSKVRDTVRSELGKQAAAAFVALQAQFARRGGEGEEAPYFCHIVCELGSTSMARVLGWFKDFLLTHPDEVLVLFIEDSVTPTDTATAFEKSGILPYAYIHKPGKPFPTLRKMIETDERLFVMAEKDAGQGSIPWYHQGFELAMETPYTFGDPQELAANASCDPFRGGTGKPLFQLNHWIEKLPRSPDTAAKVNAFEFLRKRAQTCQRIRKALPGLVAVDHYNEGDLLDVTEVLNGVPRGTQPDYREAN